MIVPAKPLVATKENTSHAAIFGQAFCCDRKMDEDLKIVKEEFSLSSS